MPTYESGTKLKTFHWSKIENKDLANTIFHELHDEQKGAGAAPALNTERLEASFAAKESKRIRKTSVEQQQEGVPKMELVSNQRRNNIKITFAAMKNCSGRDMRRALLKMDLQFLDEERVQFMSDIIPTEEEYELVSQYKGESSSLGEVERLFLTLGSVTRLKPRLNHILFRHLFAGMVEDIEADLSLYEAATTAIRGSQNLKRVLMLVLCVGNYLNSNTRKGAAFGFDLSTLGKLSSFKNTEGKGTLMDFLVEEITAKWPELRDFATELRPVILACEVDSDFLKSSVGRLNMEVKNIKEALDLEYPDGDRFIASMTSFLKQAEERQLLIKYRHEQVCKDMVSLCEYLGEDKKTKPEIMLQTFKCFVSGFWDAEKAHLQREQAARQAAAKLEAAAAITASTPVPASASRKRTNICLSSEMGQTPKTTPSAGGGVRTGTGFARTPTQVSNSDVVNDIISNLMPKSTRKPVQTPGTRGKARNIIAGSANRRPLRPHNAPSHAPPPRPTQ